METSSNQRIALITVLITSFVVPFMGSAINIALPSMSKDLEMHAILINWVPSAYLLTSSIILLPTGKLADMYGRRRLYLAGIAVFTISSVLTGLAPGVASLMTGRVLQGVGAALMFSTALPILISAYPQRDRGRVLGLCVSSTYLGLALGPVLGGALTQYLTWRSIFLGVVPFCLFSFWSSLKKLPDDIPETGGSTRFDTSGAIIFGLGLGALMIGCSRLPDIHGIVLIIIGIAAMAGFFFREARCDSPLLDVSLLKNKIFALSNVAALIHYSATFASGFLLSLYLQYIKGFTPQHAGIILIASPVMMTIFSPLAGKLSDRVEPRYIASSGMALTALGLAPFCMLDMNTPLSLIIGCLLVSGLGFAFFSSPNTNAVVSAVDKRYYGVATAILSTMRMSGQTFSMALTMVFFTIIIGGNNISHETFPGFLHATRLIFVTSLIMCLIGIMASMARGNRNTMTS